MGAGKAIDVSVWNHIKKKKVGLFIADVSVILWGKRKLVNRCFDNDRIDIQLEGRSPRKRLDKETHAVLKGARFFKAIVLFKGTNNMYLKFFITFILFSDLFNDYINDRPHLKPNKAVLMSQLNSAVGQLIKRIRNAMYERIPDV